MRFAATCNQIAETPAALDEAVAKIRAELGPEPVDLAFVFISEGHGTYDPLASELKDQLEARYLLGCSAEAVIGQGAEIESGPALSLWCARLPDVPIHTFHVEFERTPDGLVASGLPLSGDLPFEPSAVLLLGDPFSCAAEAVIEILGEEYPGLPLLGGMASGGRGPGTNILFRDGETINSGGVGVFLGPGVEVQAIVSQGCRPVGQRFLVTKAQRNIVFELGGKSALDQLGNVFSALEEQDQKLLQRGPHLGIAMNEYQDDFRRGDFLIANVLGGDRSNGAIAIGHNVRVGQTVQFHVRDGETADEDLRTLLARTLEGQTSPAAALLFSCNGRGTRMFSQPNHDVEVVSEYTGGVPIAGLFAQGELGPVAGKNHMHGFTASVALFRPGTPVSEAGT